MNSTTKKLQPPKKGLNLNSTASARLRCLSSVLLFTEVSVNRDRDAARRRRDCLCDVVISQISRFHCTTVSLLVPPFAFQNVFRVHNLGWNLSLRLTHQNE